MKIVFLDIDGVLVPCKPDGKKTRPAIPVSSAISALNRLILASEAKVVITSSWRQKTDAFKLEECLVKWGCCVKVIGSTPILQNRPTEIWQWLASNYSLVDEFVILDDEPVSGMLNEKTVFTDPLVGLTIRDVELACWILKVKFKPIS